MAQINFPVATANGQEFEADNGVIYTYVGTPPNGYWSGTFQDEGLNTLDNRYLKLDASNDPITSDLQVTGTIQSGGNPSGAQGVLLSNGAVRTARDNGVNSVFLGYEVGNSTPTTQIRANGQSDFLSGAFKITSTRLNINDGSNDTAYIDYDGLTRVTKLRVADPNQSISSSAQVVIKSPAGTDAAFQINEATTSSSLTIKQTATENSIGSGSSIPLKIGTAGNQPLFIATNGRIGINNESPSEAFDVVGNIACDAETKSLRFRASGTSNAPGGGTFGFSSQYTFTVDGGTNSNNIYPAAYKSAPTNASESLGNFAHYLAQQLTNDTGASVNVQRVFDCSSNLTDTATTTYAFSGRLSEGTNSNWNVYASGTAPNYMAGDLRIGQTGARAKLTVRDDSLSTLPAIGQPGNVSISSNTNFGLQLGTISSGEGYIQSQRNEGTATTYDLLLNPLGSNVGIGTDSPSDKLHVQGGSLLVSNSSGNNITLQTNVGNGNCSLGYLQSSGGGNLGPSTITAGDSLGKISFSGYGDSQFVLGAQIKSDSDSSGSISDSSMPANLSFWTSAGSGTSRRMTISYGGNVGIGTAGPEAKLDIQSASANHLRLYNNQSFGTAQLKLEGSRNAGTTGVGDIIFKNNALTEEGSLSVDGNGSLKYTYDGVEALSILKSGRLGINAPDPAYALDVTGDIHTTTGIIFGTQTDKLDDYEEGTWTPTYVANTTSPTVTYSIQTGLYTKVGNVVYVQGRIRTATVTDVGVGNLRIAGLPFTSKNQANAKGGTFIHNAISFNTEAPNRASVRSNTQQIELSVYAANTQSFLPVTQLNTITGNKNDIQFAAIYMVT